jgi:hypothetical protein
MSVRRTHVKDLLWFCTILLVTLSFPLQVYAGNPYPALLPYLLIGGILVFFPARRLATECSRQNRNIDLMVVIYVLLLLLDTLWQTVFGVIGFAEGISAIVVYLLPVGFYWYFSRVASEQEIRISVLAMVVAGLIAGLYFTYDSYLKLALGQVSDYSQAAFDYSVSRAGSASGEINEARIAIGYRSHGLLESHSVSAAWIIIGALAALTLMPRNRRLLRLAVILLFGTMVLLGLNFTAIIAFSIIVFLLEFSGITERRRRVSSVLGNVASVILIVGAVGWVAVSATGTDMSEVILDILSFQTALALGTGYADQSYAYILSQHLSTYYDHVSDLPLSLLFGDGFSTFGITKGGDIGFVESLAAFGLPYFLLLVFCLVNLIIRALHQVRICDVGASGGREAGLDRANALKFSAGLTLLVLITDFHYTVWPAKSVLPIFFFAIALYGRYSSAPVIEPQQARSLLKTAN